MKTLLGAFCSLALVATPASASEVKIVDVKAYLFLEHSGKFSDDIVDKGPLENIAKGGAPGKESASAVLFDLTFSGEKNATPKYATATVDITQGSITGQPTVIHKAFGNFQLGPDGLQHKALLVENATCAPLSLDVFAGKTAKSVKLEFACAR
jgi:hypothetical protein